MRHANATGIDHRLLEHPPPEKFAILQEELVAADTWMIDGNYASTLAIRLGRATDVIFLDLPALPLPMGDRPAPLTLPGGQHDSTGVYDRIT